jgi:hypothetical protein
MLQPENISAFEEENQTNNLSKIGIFDDSTLHGNSHTQFLSSLTFSNLYLVSTHFHIKQF